MVYFGHATEHFAHVIQLEGMAAAGYTDSQVTYVGMNADMMEDMSVKTGGAEAKDPMGTGLIINVVTRSGGNDLTASAAYDLQDFDWGTGDEAGSGGLLRRQRASERLQPVRVGEVQLRSHSGVYDPAGRIARRRPAPRPAHQVRQSDFSIGGPIMRDKAWFFGSLPVCGPRGSHQPGLHRHRAAQRTLRGLPLGGIGTTPVYSRSS